MALTLSFAHGFDVGPEIIKGRRDFLLAGGEVLVESFSAYGKTFVEVELLNLLGEASVYVIHGQATGGRMLGLNDIEEVGVSVLTEEGKI